MKQWKRILSALLAVCLVCGMLPTGLSPQAFAAGGSGSMDDPILISTADEWENADFSKTKYFRLTENITLNNIQCNKPELSAHLDGGGHTITLPSTFSITGKAAAQNVGGLFQNITATGVLQNVKIKTPTTIHATVDDARVESLGIVAGVNAGEISRIVVENAKLQYTGNNQAGGSIHIGIVAGTNRNKIDNIYLNNNQIVTNMTNVSALVRAGGIAGASTTKGVVKDCIVKNLGFQTRSNYLAESNNSNESFALLVGDNTGKLESCFASNGKVNITSETIQSSNKLSVNYLTAGTGEQVSECVYKKNGNISVTRNNDTVDYMNILWDDARQGTDIYEVTDESNAYQKLRDWSESLSVWHYDSDNGLTFQWQNVPKPVVTVSDTDDGMDKQITISRTNTVTEDMKVTLNYTEKGLTPSAPAPTVTRMEPQVDSIDLYVNDVYAPHGQDVKLAVYDEVLPNPIDHYTVEITAKLNGKYIVNEKDAHVTWKLEPVSSWKGLPEGVSITENGTLTVPADCDKKFIVKVTHPATNVSEQITIRLVKQTLKLEGLNSLSNGDSINMQTLSAPWVDSFTVTTDGDVPTIGGTANNMTVELQGNAHPDTKLQAGTSKGEYTLTISNEETASSLKLVANVNGKKIRLKEIKLQRPGIEGSSLSLAADPIVFMPGEVQPMTRKVTLSGTPMWTGGLGQIPEQQYKVVFRLAEDYPHVQLAATANKKVCDLIVEPAYVQEVNGQKPKPVQVIAEVTAGLAKYEVRKTVSISQSNQLAMTIPNSEGLFGVYAVSENGDQVLLPYEKVSVAVYPTAAGVMVNRLPEENENYGKYNVRVTADGKVSNKDENVPYVFVARAGTEQLVQIMTLKRDKTTKQVEGRTVFDLREADPMSQPIKETYTLWNKKKRVENVIWSITEAEGNGVSTPLEQMPSFDGNVLTVPYAEEAVQRVADYKITASVPGEQEESETTIIRISVIYPERKDAQAETETFQSGNVYVQPYTGPQVQLVQPEQPQLMADSSALAPTLQEETVTEIPFDSQPVYDSQLGAVALPLTLADSAAVLAEDTKPDDQFVYGSGSWVPKASAQRAYNVSFADVNPQTVYLGNAGLRSDPDESMIEIVDTPDGQKWQMIANADGLPKGTVWNGNYLLVSEQPEILLAVCAKDQNVNLERSSTQIYSITQRMEEGDIKCVVTLLPELSQPSHAGIDMKAHSFETTIPLSEQDPTPFTREESSTDVIYRADVAQIRALVAGDSMNQQDECHRGLAEGEALRVEATILTTADFGGISSDESNVGTKLPAPNMDPLPGTTGKKAGEVGVSLYSARENTKIFFTVNYFTDTTDEVFNPEPSDDAEVYMSGAAHAQKTYLYQQGHPIQLPYNVDKMQVRAIAVSTEPGREGDRSRVSVETYTTADRMVLDMPTLLVKDSQNPMRPFDPDEYYQRTGLVLRLDHPNMDVNDPNHVEIRYKVSTRHNENVLPDSPVYDPDKGIDLSGVDLETASELHLYIRVTRTGENFSDAKFTLRFPGDYKLPVICYVVPDLDHPGEFIEGSVLKNGDKIASGAKVILKPHTDDVATEMQPAELPAVEIRDKQVTLPNGNTQVVRNGEKIVHNDRTEQRVDLFAKEYTTPSIEYCIGDTGPMLSYRQGRPRILQTFPNNDVETKTACPNLYSLSPKEAAQILTLPEGAPGTVFNLTLRIFGSDNNRNEITQTLSFTIQDNLPPPTVDVKEVEDKPGVIEVNERISLRCAAPNSEIFYTLNNADITSEDVQRSINWEKDYTAWLQDPAHEPALTDGITPQNRYDYRQQYISETKVKEPPLIHYTIPFPAEQNPQKSFWLRAVAVSTDPSTGHSKQADWYFKLEDLDPAEPAKAFPETSDENPTALKRGEMIRLSTGTINPKIYYTTDGTTPDPDAYLKCTNKEDFERCSTKAVDSGDSIPMEPEEDTFVIRAIVRENSRPSILSDSEEVRFTYRLAYADYPQVMPETNSTVNKDLPVAKLAPGASIIMRMAENIEVYYTTDGSIPVVPAKGNQPQAPTMRYDGTSGIKMEKKDAFFLLTVVAHDTSGNSADSIPVTYYFQNPAEVQAVYAVPAATTPVVKGTKVVLKTSTEEARIFYEVSYGLNEEPRDPVPNISQSFDPENPIVIDQPMKIKAMAEKDGMRSAVALYDYQVAPELPMPIASVPSGSNVFAGLRLQLAGSTGADIIYTKDGSDPTDPENKNRLYGSHLVLDGVPGDSMTIRAYCTKPLYTPSAVETFTYSICKEETVLQTAPDPDTPLSQGTVISMSTDVTGGVIYYTTNGTDPLRYGKPTNGIKVSGAYGSTISLTMAVGLRNAITGEIVGSTPVVRHYKLQQQAQSPTASLSSGTITMDGTPVTLKAQNGMIFYTTDGTTPTASSALYTEPILVNRSMVLKAIAVVDGMAPSKVVSYTYTRAGDVVAPQSSITGGEIISGTQISLTCDTDGATIYYSSDGTDPSPEMLDKLFRYTDPIMVTRPVTLKFMAVKQGMHPSAVNSATFTVREPPAPPEDSDDTEGLLPTETDRLASRRTFNQVNQEHRFTDVVLYDEARTSVVSGPTGSMEKDMKLTVFPADISDKDRQAVRNVEKRSDAELEIREMYEVTLLQDGIKTKPTKDVEIGLPIPAEYQNGIVVLCRMNEDGSVTDLETRRAGGRAFAMVDEMGIYAVTSYEEVAAHKSGAIYWIGGGLAGLALLAAAGWLIWRRKKAADQTQAPADPQAEDWSL